QPAGGAGRRRTAGRLERAVRARAGPPRGAGGATPAVHYGGAGGGRVRPGPVGVGRMNLDTAQLLAAACGAGVGLGLWGIFAGLPGTPAENGPPHSSWPARLRGLA